MKDTALGHSEAPTTGDSVGDSPNPTDSLRLPSWYAIHTRSRHEKVVAVELAAKRIEHFLPLVPCRRRWSDRYVTVEEPLFPGYVMVRLIHQDYDQRVAVLGSRGVAGFVGDGRVAWSIPDLEVDAVRAVVHSRLTCLTHPYLHKGDYVEVIHGPLMGVRGILVREPKKHRLVVSVTLFAQSVSVEVDVADVRPLTH